jgi:aspartate-semialdehyde dehydrogenase
MKIAIIGATGEVGRMMLTCLEEFQVPVSEIELFASQRSEGSTIFFNDTPVKVQRLTEAALCRKYDYILMSAGGAISKHYSPIAADAGNVLIDNSSAWRRMAEIPLVVPEINGDLLTGYRGIVANPNCSTIQLVLALYPLHLLFRLTKVVVSTYQSVSGSGHAGIETLSKQQQGSSDPGVYPEQIYQNVIPQIGAFEDDGYSVEEDKMRYETGRILGIKDLAVCATTVRVPVIYGHAEAVYAEFERQVELQQAALSLATFPSVKYHVNTYQTPLHLGNSNDSHVSRLRYGVNQHSLSFWNTGHNVRLGAATNAVRILLKHHELNQG